MDTDETMDMNNDNTVPALTRNYTLDCAICMQPFVQPVQLPCSHTFCFLCAKGIALQGQPCALCRADIPVDLLTKPDQFQAKHRLSSQQAVGDADPERFVWYYQGHKGWWQYDERTAVEIEEAFSKKEKTVDILIAGAIYVIDFESMVQYQRNTNSRKRKIKRDSVTAQKKGVAGMTHGSNQPGTDVAGTSTDTPSVGLRKAPLGDGSGDAD